MRRVRSDLLGCLFIQAANFMRHAFYRMISAYTLFPSACET